MSNPSQSALLNDLRVIGEDAEIRLVDDFNKQFKTKVNFEVLSKLLGTKTVLPWYHAWRARRAKDLSVPEEWYKDVGLTPEEWEIAQTVRASRVLVRAGILAEKDALAERFKNAVAVLDAKERDALSEYNNPLALLLETTYQDLPLGAQIKIESASDESSRNVQLKKSVIGLRKDILSRIREGKGYFRA